MKNLQFLAEARLGSSVEKTISFEMSTENGELSLVWDDVYEKACETAEREFPREDFPNMEVKGIFILTEDGKFPVLPEDEDVKSLGSSYEKVLVLPYAIYSLTPEYKAFLTLSKRGLINGDFDADAMRTILDAAKDTEK